MAASPSADDRAYNKAFKTRCRAKLAEVVLGTKLACVFKLPAVKRNLAKVGKAPWRIEDSQLLGSKKSEQTTHLVSQHFDLRLRQIY
jgi:hypothetical protein